MKIPDNYTPTPGDLLIKGEKMLHVHWVKEGECGYGIDFGRGGIEALHRRPADEFAQLCREQGASLVAPPGFEPECSVCGTPLEPSVNEPGVWRCECVFESIGEWNPKLVTPNVQCKGPAR